MQLPPLLEDILVKKIVFEFKESILSGLENPSYNFGKN